MPEFAIVLDGDVVLEGEPADREDCYLLQRVTGLGEGRDRVEQVEQLAGADGVYLGPASRGGILLTVEGVIVAPDRAALRTKRRALLAKLEPIDAEALYPVEVTGREGYPDVVADMRPAIPLAAPETNVDGRWLAPYQAALRSEAYAWQGASHALDVEPGNLTGGRVYPLVYPKTYSAGLATPVLVTNAGDAKVWPVLRVHGRSVAPIVENLTTGERLSFPALTVSEGTYLEIDPAARTVTLGGDPAQSRYSARDDTVSAWWGLVPGANALRFTDTDHSASARLEVLFADGYL